MNAHWGFFRSEGHFEHKRIGVFSRDSLAGTSSDRLQGVNRFRDERHEPRTALAQRRNSLRTPYSSLWRNFVRTVKSSRVVVSPLTVPPMATSLSNRRMILPLRVLG